MLADALLDADSRVSAYRASSRVAISKAIGGGLYAGGLDPSGNGGVFDFRKMGALTNQYKAAMTGIPYTAIRPAAVKIAGQPVHIGYKEKPGDGGEKSPPLRTKRLEIERRKAGGVLLSKNLRLCEKSPMFVKQHANNVVVLDSHPFLDAIEEPNEYMTQWALMWCSVFSIYATGHCVWVLDDTNDRLRIYYVPTTWANPIHKPGRPYAAWKIKPLGSSEDVPETPAENVVHFMLPDPANPMLAHSPMMAHARAINTDDQLQISQYSSMKNGIRPGVILKAGTLPPPPGSSQPPMRPHLTPEQRKQLISAIQLAYRGVERHGEPVIVDGMIEDIVPFTRSPQEMDYPEGAKLTESRIMKGIGTNPIVAGEIEGANRASAYVAHDGFYEINVNPLAAYMSQVITRRIGPFYRSGTRQIVAWIEEAKAFDKDLADGRMKTATSAGAITRGELRRWAATGEIDLPERDDDDELLKPPPAPGKQGQEPGQNQEPNQNQGGGKRGEGKDDGGKKRKPQQNDNGGDGGDEGEAGEG